jgi:hypothetical protein
MLLHGGRIYIAAGEDGVYVIDAAAGAGDLSPAPVRVYAMPGVALNLDVVDGVLVVASGYAGLHLRMVQDAAPSANPTPLPDDKLPHM